MQSTKNYQLVKQELTDVSDITQISGNWDKIDTEMKKLSDDKFDKSGGTVTGATTFEKGTTTKGGATVDTLTVQWGTTTDTLNVKGASTLGGDATVNGKVITDNVRAKGQSLNVGVTMGGSELVGFIAQLVGGTTPRMSVTHHPSADSNDKSVATTNWVKNLKATANSYGLVKVATPEVAIDPDADDAAITPATYHDVSDFRHKSTAYKIGDKVECMFNHELWLECTKAGTTCADPLDTRNVKHGQVLTDGEAQWTVRTHIVTVNGSTPDENGDVQVQAGLGEDDIKRVVLNTFFPVGSTYISADANFNPNTWGGTWVKIENRFLLGSGSKGVGAQGGEENVTLNTNQIPSHSHSRGTTNITGAFVTGKMAYSESPEKNGIGAFSLIGTDSRTANGSEYSGGRYNFDATRSWSGTSDFQGGSQSHNNMPPYEVVNIWKRTA